MLQFVRAEWAAVETVLVETRCWISLVKQWNRKTMNRNEEEEAENGTLGNTLWDPGGEGFAAIDAIIVRKLGQLS